MSGVSLGTRPSYRRSRRFVRAVCIILTMTPAFLQVLPTSAGNLRGLSHEIMAQIGPGHDGLDGITSLLQNVGKL